MDEFIAFGAATAMSDMIPERFLDYKMACVVAVIERFSDYDSSTGADFTTYLYPFITDAFFLVVCWKKVGLWILWTNTRKSEELHGNTAHREKTQRKPSPNLWLKRTASRKQLLNTECCKRDSQPPVILCFPAR